jgi:hypothetical protein
MRHHVVFTIECDGEAPPGLLAGIAQAMQACLKAAGKNVPDGYVTTSICEDPKLAEHSPLGISITFDELALRQHAALAEFGKFVGEVRGTGEGA